MTWSPISSIPPQYEDLNGQCASGAVLKAYSAGTSTPISFATDSTGNTQAATITLNSLGYPEVSGNIVIPHVEESFKLSLYPSQDAADTDTGAVWTMDNLEPLFAPTSFVRTLLDDASAAAALTTLGLSTYIQTLIDDATAAAARSTLKTGTIGIPENYSLDPSVASSALTMAVKTAAGSDPSATDPVSVLIPDGTGGVNRRTITAALSLTISSGSTLGHNSALKQYIYWYLIDNAGTVELAASFKYFGKHGIVTTTAEGGAGAADTGTTMYSASARTSVPFVCIGYSEDTQATAGTWATEPSAIHLAPFELPVISFSAHKNGTNQTGVATLTPTLVTFPTTVYNNGGLWDTTTGEFKPLPGQVRLLTVVYIATTVDQKEYIVEAFKNGALLRSNRRVASGTIGTPTGIDVKDECNGSDVYKIMFTHNDGTTQTIVGTTGLTYVTGSWSPGRS